MSDSDRRGKTAASLGSSTPTEYRIDMTEDEVRQRIDATGLRALLGTRIADVDTIESLPVGAVLAGNGMAWQKQADGWWYPSSFSWIKQRGAAVMAGYEPTLIWLPTEPADSAGAAIRRACTGSDDYARENVESLMRITAELLGYDVVKVADR